MVQVMGSLALNGVFCVYNLIRRAWSSTDILRIAWRNYDEQMISIVNCNE